MSVVLVIAVGLFLLRDNIAKFINNAATQIAGEESNDGLNEYGFYFDKTYWSEEDGSGMIFQEDGSIKFVNRYGNEMGSAPPGFYSYSQGAINDPYGGGYTFSSDGKTVCPKSDAGLSFELQE